MESIQAGDTVFDETGSECLVLGTSEIMMNHSCYRVSFSDGGSIIADAKHLWSVAVYTPCKEPYSKPAILTTEQMKDNIKHSYGSYNYRIVLNGSLQYPKKELVIQPYVLGVWLGDGRKSGAQITINTLDISIIENINNYGIPTNEYFDKQPGSRTFVLSDGDRRQAKRNICIQANLRKLGLLHNKHIPVDYLYSIETDRRLLLKGLMDTDGYVSITGECEYTSVDKQLAEDVLTLIRSLGYKASMGTGRAMLKGKDCGEKYRIRFYAYSNESVFTLERKSKGLKPLPGKPTKNSFKTITAIEPVSSVPVKCLAVDSKSHLYLAGENLIPTHNTELGAALALFMLVADGEYGAEIYSCAADRAQASLIYTVAVDMISLCPALKKRVKVMASQKRIIYPAMNSFYQVLSSEAYSKHGINPHAVLYDELHVANREMARVMLHGASDARRQPLNFLITTAGNDLHSIGYEIHQKAVDILEGRKTDRTFYPVIYAAKETDDWTKPSTWRKANPSMGVTVDEEKLAIACENARQTPAEENSFKQLRLCIWTKQSIRWMPMEKWDKCDLQVDPQSLIGLPCYGGLDLSSTTDLTAFVLVFPPVEGLDKYQILPYFWMPKDNIDLRVRRDHVQYDIWAQQGYIKTTEGNVVHYGFIESFIEELATKYNIREIAFDRWGAVQMTQNLEGLGFTVVPFGQGFKDMSPSTKELMKLTLEQRLAHSGHPALRWCMDNIFIRTDPAGNIKPDKEKSIEKIDGAVATIMALDRAIRNAGNNSGSVYDERGILVL